MPSDPVCLECVSGSVPSTPRQSRSVDLSEYSKMGGIWHLPLSCSSLRCSSSRRHGTLCFISRTHDVLQGSMGRGLAATVTESS